MSNIGNFKGTLYPDLYKYLTKCLSNDTLPSDSYFQILQNVLEYYYYFNSLPNNTVIIDFFNTLDTTLNELTSSNNVCNYTLYYTWLQIYNNTYAIAKDTFIDGPSCDYNYQTCTNVDYSYNNRDRQMAQNALWLLSNINETLLNQQQAISITNKRKMIIWTHNSHGSKDWYSLPDTAYQIDGCSNKPKPCQIVRAAQHVRKELGLRSYSIASTAFSGEIGCNTCPCSVDHVTTYIYAPYSSLEYYFRQAFYPVAAFLDFRNNNLPQWLKSILTVGFDTYIQVYGNYTNIFDGVIFYHKNYGVTCL